MFFCQNIFGQSHLMDKSVRAGKGDTVYIFVNHIKQDKRQEFEDFVTNTFWGMSKKLPTKDQQVFKHTRVLYPTKAEPDGTWSYIFIMDPVVPGGEYNIRTLLVKMYGEQKADEYDKLFSETAAHEQTGYVEIQSEN